MSTDLVNVAVPLQHLSRVYGLIAQLEGKVVDVLVPKTDDLPEADAVNDEWTPSRIQKMVLQSAKPMRNVLMALASRSGEWLSTQELADAIEGKNADWNTIAGMFGAFNRRCKNRYGLNTLPFDRRYEHGVGKVFRMSKEISQHVLRALKNGR